MHDVNSPNNSNPTRHQRPGFVSVQLPKKQLEEKGSLGFGLRVENGDVKINTIRPDGLLIRTGIQEGDVLTSLGGSRPPVVKEVEELQGFVSNTVFSPSGGPNVTVTVETQDGDARISEAVVFKEDRSIPIGLSFINDQKSGLLQISKINPNGLLGPHSALHVGDYIEQINTCDVTSFDVKMTKNFLTSIAGPITIRIRRLSVDANKELASKLKNPHPSSAHTPTKSTDRVVPGDDCLEVSGCLGVVCAAILEILNAFSII